MFIIVFQQTTSLCAYVCPKFFFIELQRIFFFISSRAGHVLFSSSFTWFGFRLPPLSVPSLSKISNIFSDAFVIAVVIFATNISLSTMFAKKRGYSVDPNQVCLLRIVHEWKKTHTHNKNRRGISGWRSGILVRARCWVLGKTLFFHCATPRSPFPPARSPKGCW